MKFLIVGLGSMGKRRIRNLQYLREKDIIGFDLREDRRKESEEKYEIKTFMDFKEAMRENPDALIISTPPDLHIEYAVIAAEKNKHFFMEAGILNERMAKLIDLCKNKSIVAAPSCTMRFHPAVKVMKKLVDDDKIGRILAFTHHSGQYLPDWHPWENYRAFYVSKRETGACKEIVPFELVWITWLLGTVKKVACTKGKLSNLDVDIDDVYQLLFEFESGALGNMLVDVIARYPIRHCKILGENGLIIWDWNERCVKLFDANEKKWIEYPQGEGIHEKGYVPQIIEDMYIEEMDYFIKAIKGDTRYPYTLEEDKKILDILYLAEQSSDEGKHISIKSR